MSHFGSHLHPLRLPVGRVASQLNTSRQHGVLYGRDPGDIKLTGCSAVASPAASPLGLCAWAAEVCFTSPFVHAYADP